MSRNTTFVSYSEVQASFVPVISSFKSNQIAAHIINAMFPQNRAIPSSNWRFLNRVKMLSTQTTDARSSFQWMQVGRQIISGSRAYFLFCPEYSYQSYKGPKGRPVWKKYINGYSATKIYRRADTEGTELPADNEVLFRLPLKNRAQEWDINTSLKVSNCPGFTCYTPRSRNLKYSGHEELSFLQDLVSVAYSLVPKKSPSSLGPDGWEIINDICIQVIVRMMRKKFSVPGNNSYRFITDIADDLRITPEWACTTVLRETEQVLSLIINGK